MFDFKSGRETLTAIVRDAYQSFSIGEACDIQHAGKFDDWI